MDEDGQGNGRFKVVKSSNGLYLLECLSASSLRLVVVEDDLKKKRG